MKTTINGNTAAQVEDIKRFPTVTHPIKADDLNVPQAYAYTLRRAIVTDCNSEQRAELAKLLDGKDATDGVIFSNTNANRHLLQIWQNHEARKQRAAILGEGWQWVEGLNHGTKVGDCIVCTDGKQGRVKQCSPESCCIEFETADGQRLSVAGYFRKERKEYVEEITEEVFNDLLTIKVGDCVKVKTQDTPANVVAISEDGRHYTVKFTSPVRSLWTDEVIQTATYSRYGITRNYDRMTGEVIEGNAIYYAEELQAEYWGDKPRTFIDMEIFKPTEKRPTWLVVSDIFSEPKVATLYEICDYLAALYQEKRKA